VLAFETVGFEADRNARGMLQENLMYSMGGFLHCHVRSLSSPTNLTTSSHCHVSSLLPTVRAACSKHYSIFFTFWDDLNGSSSHKQPPCSILVLTMHAIYQATLLGSIYAFITNHRIALAAYIACYWLVPPSVAAAAADWARLPQVTRALCSWLMDAYRRDNHITYNAGAAFRPSVVAAEEATDEDRDVSVARPDKDQDAHEPTLIFACHPTGDELDTARQ
jgi:hypothetical protein